MTDKKEGLALLREPFAENQISKMCRSTKKDNPKSKCGKCGGYHGQPAVQLSYVGHAALTDRLLDADEKWTWEPLALGQDGYPVVDKDGGMWIKLTVCGVTRLGYGDNQNRTAGDGVKERIGDALRNAAMRFGAALELWHKGDLHIDEDEEKSNGDTHKPQNNEPGQTTPRQDHEARIKKSLIILYGDNKAAMRDKLIELTTWKNKEGKEFKGMADYTQIKSDKSVEILCDKLEKLANATKKVDVSSMIAEIDKLTSADVVVEWLHKNHELMEANLSVEDFEKVSGHANSVVDVFNGK